MTEQRIFTPENLPIQERRRITPDDFIEDGNSRLAQEFARSWIEAQVEFDLTAIIGCCDSRTIYNPKNAVGIRTISAAVPDALFGNVLSRGFGTKDVVVMSHHDGTKIEPGVRPSGCGGRDEKAKMRGSNEKPVPEGAAYFVHNHVAHEDPIVSSYSNALKIAEIAKLPTLATTLDHVSGILIPLAAFEPTADGGIKYYSEISMRKILDGHYSPSEIYENGIPGLNPEAVPDEFKAFLRRHERYISEIKEKNPNFEENQLIQNPDIVLLTTVVRPSRGRLPSISGKSSNRVFAITVARKSGDERADVDEQSIIAAADEAEYPLVHGLKSKGDRSLPFSSLYNNGTVIVETRNMARSMHVAKQLLTKPWFNEWAKNPGNNIIIAQTTRGIVDTAEYFQNS